MCLLRIGWEVEDGDGFAEPGAVFAANVGGDGDGFSVGGGEAEDGEVGGLAGAFMGGLAECDDLAGGGLCLGEEDGAAGSVEEADGQHKGADRNDEAEEEVSERLLEKGWHGWEFSKELGAGGDGLPGSGRVWDKAGEG